MKGAPYERLERPQFMSPPLIAATSGANQFAGRTSLGSGQATVTVSTTRVHSDSIIPLNVEAALAATYATQGLIAVASGVAFGVASTPAVYSGQVISLSVEGATNQLSGQGRGFRANSIVDGKSFAVATEDGQGVTGDAVNVMWKIHGKDPVHPKINTISDGNFFTIGWPDGQARPFGATIHWHILRTN